MARRLQTGEQQNLALAWKLCKNDGSGGATGLSPTIKIVNPDGTLATLTDDALTEESAANAPGVYEYEVVATDLTQSGVGGSQAALHKYIVDPNDASVDAPPEGVFERLAGVATTAPPPAYNLCSLADVQDILLLGPITGGTTPAQDTLIEDKIIPRVSNFFENETSRQVVARDHDETGDGEGYPKHFVKNPPINSVDQVWIDGDELDAADRDFDPRGWIIYKGGYFPQGSRIVRVTYNGGWASVPAEIVELACEMSAHRFQEYHRNLLGVLSEDVGEGNRSYESRDFLRRHLRAIRRFSVGFFA